MISMPIKIEHALYKAIKTVQYRANENIHWYTKNNTYIASYVDDGIIGFNLQLNKELFELHKYRTKNGDTFSGIFTCKEFPNQQFYQFIKNDFKKICDMNMTLAEYQNSCFNKEGA